jgi:sterol 3beta-glucosyltransferase
LKIIITSHGTRGDVQPYLALAVGLQQAGHEVTLVTSSNYTEWVHSYGVRTHPTQFSLQELMKKPEVQAIMRSRNYFKKLKLFFGEMMAQGPQAMEAVWAAIQSADFVIQSPASSGALEAAELRTLPGAMAYPVPFAPTEEFPSFFLGSARFSLGAKYNRLTHKLMHLMLWNGMSGPMTNRLRKDIGLSKISSFAEQASRACKLGIISLYGFSELVISRPADWDDFQHITGYWFLEADAEWKPDPELVDFIQSGPPPVYLGFGSMDPGDSERFTRLLLQALEMSGQRGVILTGWAGLERITASSDIFFIDDVPHSWLFPRTKAVIHHGGAGTTGAGLRAGVPSIIAPLASDQYAWAERVVQLGVGPRTPSMNNLTSEKLAQSIITADTDTAMRARADALGRKLREENGLTRAVDLIESKVLELN